MVLIALGITSLAWGAVTWRWGDPVTGYYTKRVQTQLERDLEDRRQQFRSSTRSNRQTRVGPVATRPRLDLRREAARYRTTLGEGDAVGRLVVPRLGLTVVLVFATDSRTLRKGPGIHASTGLPGQGGLIYVAGHRTTYLAPFAHIDRLRAGDTATIELPYGSFRYRVTGTRIVDDDDLSVLAPTAMETLRLQACHPRFRATQRIVVSARLVRATEAAA
jgi:sortase A